MKTSTIFIPKIINVGYQHREGTYTGKLAYVIYTDEKGTLRKEASWNSWRDKSIEPNTFDNVPTTGFVLNKKVGDTCSHWNFRQAYCRVYDPRGFEFEITIENLLYILENTNSIVGKGLEGEFVYGWDGKDLVLMPTCSPDYKDIQEYNNAVFSETKITGKDLKVGTTYKGKDGQSYVYIGRYMEYTTYYGPYTTPQEEKGLMYWFWVFPENNSYPFMLDYGEYDDIKGCWSKDTWNNISGSYTTRKSVPKGFLISVIDETVSPHLSNIIEIISRKPCYSKMDITNLKYKFFTKQEFLKYVKDKYYETPDYHRMYWNDFIPFFTKPIASRADNYTLGEADTKVQNLKLYKKIPTTDCYKRTVYDVRHDCNIQDVFTGTLTEGILNTTIADLYDQFKPCYADIMLENGKVYKRIYEWLPRTEENENGKDI